MCVMSMIMDHYQDRWYPIVYPQATPMWPSPQAISAEEVAEFRRLLDRAREYDKRHNEPDCELDAKRQALKALAKQLGVDISFVDKPDGLGVGGPIGERHEARPRLS